MRRLPSVFRLAGREPSASQDVASEIGFHLDEMTEWLMSQGWSESDAREEARRRFGDVDRVRQGLRRVDEGSRRRRRWGERFEGIRQDVAYALRGLRRSPGFTVVVLLTLGLAIGANATMFGVVDRLLLRPPDHIPNAHEIRRITVARWIENSLSDPWDAISWPAFNDLRDRTSSFSQVAASVVSAASSSTLGSGQP